MEHVYSVSCVWMVYQCIAECIVGTSRPNGTSGRVGTNIGSPRSSPQSQLLEHLHILLREFYNTAHICVTLWWIWLEGEIGWRAGQLVSNPKIAFFDLDGHFGHKFCGTSRLS